MKFFSVLTHFYGRITGHYYFEDYKRVYPGEIFYNRLGISHKMTRDGENNYINHRKFYLFAAQFVANKRVADVGCGSGYGCEILKQHDASQAFGCDASKHSIDFAKNHFGEIAQFTVQSITNLKNYKDDSFDVTMSSEVLEHIKEYHQEHKAIQELKRVTRNDGLVIIGTPNSELMGDHGFFFEEIDALISSHFNVYCIFENALLPPGEEKQKWLQRSAAGKLGVIVSEKINLEETAFINNEIAEIKVGLEPGLFRLDDTDIDTRLLHNTHSWIVVAKKKG